MSSHGELDCEVTLLTHPNKRHGPAHPGCQTGHDPAALVHNASQVDATLLELLAEDLAAIYAASFLIMPKTEQDRALWAVALLQERLRSFHDPNQLVLDVQRAASPDEAIHDLAFEGRVCPLSRIGRDDVLVRHEHHRLQVRALPLPDVEQAITVDHFSSEFLVHQGIGFFQHLVELFKCRRVWRSAIIKRDGLAAHCRRQVLCHLLLINRNPFNWINSCVASIGRRWSARR